MKYIQEARSYRLLPAANGSSFLLLVKQCPGCSSRYPGFLQEMTDGHRVKLPTPIDPIRLVS